MRWILKDANGKIIAASDSQFSPEYIFADEEYELGYDGQFHSESEMQNADYQAKKAEHNKQEALIDLRIRRNEECFPIVNRGALWYDKLTEEQKEELSSWYEEWLNAPATGIIPSKPTWIDSVTKNAP